MKKITKTTFRCDYCNKEFKSPTQCNNHELKCKIKTQDINRLTEYILCLLLHYHKKGYKIAIKYDDKYDTDLIVDLTNC